jgi:hypothetical protein
MPTRRFKRIALARLLIGACAAMFGACVHFAQAQAQPGYVPPSPPPPPPVLNPSSPSTVPQPSYRPITPTTPSTTPSPPSTVPSDEVRSPVSEEAPSTTPRSERAASVGKTRGVHHHHGGFAGITWPYYCGSSPCVRIVVAEPPPVYRASVLWWPGFYDYAPGQFGRGRPVGAGIRGIPAITGTENRSLSIGFVRLLSQSGSARHTVRADHRIG